MATEDTKSTEKRKITTEEFKLRLTTTLAPMLVTVAVFSLGAVSLIKDPGCTFTDEFLSIFAAFCIFAAAAIVDSALDDAGITGPKERFFFLQFGYFAFCLVLGFLTTTVGFLYVAKQADSVGQPYQWLQGINGLFLLTGLSVIGKMMLFRDRNVLVALMFVLFLSSGYCAYLSSPTAGTCTSQGSHVTQHLREIPPETGDIFFDETWP